MHCSRDWVCETDSDALSDEEGTGMIVLYRTPPGLLLWSLHYLNDAKKRPLLPTHV